MRGRIDSPRWSEAEDQAGASPRQHLLEQSPPVVAERIGEREEIQPATNAERRAGPGEKPTNSPRQRWPKQPNRRRQRGQTSALLMPAAQNMPHASTAARKHHAMAAPLIPNVVVRSQIIPRNGKASAMCSLPVKSGRPWLCRRVKATKDDPDIHIPKKRICATGPAETAKSAPIQYRNRVGDSMIAGAQTAAKPYPIVDSARAASTREPSADKPDMRGKNVRPNAVGIALLL